MNIERTISNKSNLPLVTDGRIYSDSKGRPVGLAGKVNRITHAVEVPAFIPVMTPEDKVCFNLCFERCVKTVRQFIQSQAQHSYSGEK